MVFCIILEYWDLNFINFTNIIITSFFFFFRYLLQPRENGNKSSKTDDLGSLRLNICYTEDCVLPSEYYASLRNLLLKSSDVQVLLLKITSQMKTWNGLCSPVWDHVWKYAKLEFISLQYFCQNSLSNLQNTVFQITKIVYFKRTSKDSEVSGAVWLEVILVYWLLFSTLSSPIGCRQPLHLEVFHGHRLIIGTEGVYNHLC